LDKPIISTSANLSGEPSPASFKDISAHIINKVDYVVPQEYAEGATLNPSRLIKFIDDYNFVVIRE
ncbi:MAG TPA: Sua5/YciO/YrdC/YwlC family protein, partial [Bacteroidales bacterium]|nr:Sua5/YciO/YrdC/YwlC family protein [Bacteroidales bacterium]